MLRSMLCTLGALVVLAGEPVWADVASSIILSPDSGRYYEVITDPVDFPTAKTTAESKTHNGIQGRLAVINDFYENAFAFACANRVDMWIGLTDDPNYGAPADTWVWTGPDGVVPLDDTGFTRWKSGYPGNAEEDEHCARLNYVGEWEVENGASKQVPALIEYGQNQEVAKGFFHRRVSGSIYANTASEITAQTATVNFADYTSTRDGNSRGEKTMYLGTTVFPGAPGWLKANDDYFSMKSYVTIEIPEAGTYTIGGQHDDTVALAFDRGSQAAVTANLPGWTGWPSSPTPTEYGMGTTTVTFDTAGIYNVYCLYREETDASALELAMVKGNYDTSAAITEAEYLAIRDNFVANASLIGDTLNGGLATKNLRQIYTADGFTVNSTISADTLNISSTTNQGGSFGGDQTIAAGSAITATSQLVVPENSGGWWTLGVGQSQEGTLAITKNGQPVAFSQASGTTNGAAIAANGAMTWNAPATGQITDNALGAVYLEPGTYDISVDYNPNQQTTPPGSAGPTLNVVDGTFEVMNASPISGTISTIGDAINLMLAAKDNNGQPGGIVEACVTGTYSTINFEEEGTDEGHFAGDTFFPLYPSGQEVTGTNDPYAVLVTADITVDAQSAGFWSFCVNSDDGFMMQIYDETNTAVEFNEFANTSDMQDDTQFAFATGRGADDSFASINLSEGTYTMMLAHWDGSKDASLEISYANGEQLSFDSDLFTLLGESKQSGESLELFAAAGIHSEFNCAFDLLGNALAFEDQSAFTGESKIAGDANNDGKVDGSDVTILAGNWQKGVSGGPVASWADGDFNNDGKVDGSDVTILAGNWQYGVNTAAASVPEPSTLLLLLGSIATLCLVRRRK